MRTCSPHSFPQSIPPGRFWPLCGGDISFGECVRRKGALNLCASKAISSAKAPVISFVAELSNREAPVL